jgi:hypothetical protein
MWNLRATLILLLALGLMALGCGVAQAAYYPGFVWDRSVDYDEGTVVGSTLGNPNTDAEGNPAWSIESTNALGTGLGGASPWYEGTTFLHVWDDSWYGGAGAWTRGDNVNPPIRGTSMTANISSAGLRSNVPLVRWINPVDYPTKLDITGDLRIDWRGGGGTSANIDFDVAVAKHDVLSDTWTVLYGSLFEKPHDDNSFESLTKSVSLSGVWVQPGDEIIVSPWAYGSSGSTWPSLADDLTFSIAAIVIPEPATLFIWTLLGAAALAAGWRRRR